MNDIQHKALTERERQCLDLLTQGLWNPEIAERLGLARETVHGHLKHAFVKIGAKNRIEAAVIWTCENCPERTQSVEGHCPIY